MSVPSITFDIWFMNLTNPRFNNQLCVKIGSTVVLNEQILYTQAKEKVELKLHSPILANCYFDNMKDHHL